MNERLLAHPPDVEAWAVFGDELLASGDPRGELIARELAGRGLGSLLRDHPRAFFGPFEPGGPWAKAGTLDLRLGFWHRLVLGMTDAVELPHAALDHEAARFLHTLEVTIHGFPDVVVGGIVARPRPLRVLHLSGPVSWRLDALWAAVPRLEELVVVGRMGRLGVPRGPLRRLALHTRGLDGVDARSLREASLPLLDTLILPGRWDSVRVLGNPMLAGLRRLAFHEPRDCEAIVDRLAGHARLAQLSELELRGGDLHDASGLLSGAFDHLTRLDVSSNFLPTVQVDALARHFGERLRAAHQEWLGDDDDTGDPRSAR